MLVLQEIARYWWTFVLRGVIAIAFGVLAFAQPGLTLQALILLFAFWVILDGVLSLIHSIGAAQSHEPWWPFVLVGLLGLAAGLAALRWPGITSLAFLFIVAYWAIFTGILQIAAAIRLRHEIQGEVWLVLGGIASVVFGVLLVLSPGSGILALIWLVGLYAVIFGITLVLVGFRLKGMAGRMPALAK